MAENKHKKGEVAPGKVNRNWRILKTVDENLHREAVRLGFGENGVAALLNNLLTRYFNGEVLMFESKKRDQ